MNNLQKINELLESGKARKHGTYDQTGIVCVDLKPVWGSCGTDVNHAYIDPREVEVVTSTNAHYGKAVFTEKGTLLDRSNRSEFEIV